MNLALDSYDPSLGYIKLTNHFEIHNYQISLSLLREILVKY